MKTVAVFSTFVFILVVTGALIREVDSRVRCEEKPFMVSRYRPPAGCEVKIRGYWVPEVRS